MTSTAPTIACPKCGAPATGKFCAECGAAVGGAACRGCQAALTAGAKFCHRCGTPAGALPGPTRVGAAGAPDAPAGRQSVLPWAVAGVALLALIAFAAARNFNRAQGSGLDGPVNALPQAGLDFAQGDPNAGAAGAAGAPGRAPDISQMSPEERASRLFDRVMRYVSTGVTDSVQMFLPMAIAAHEQLGDAKPLDADQRYHLGLLREAGGDAAGVKAESDAILRDDPTHLFGLALAVRAADMRRDAAALKEARARLVAAEAEEMAKTTRPEYEAHKLDIQKAIDEAKKAR